MTNTSPTPRGAITVNYLEWLKARIAHAEEAGELWMLDPCAIKRGWEAARA